MNFGKRIDGIGGRRRAHRKPVLAPASAITLDEGKLVVLTNLSRHGARIRGFALNRGKDLWLRTGSIDTLATVVWRRHDLCGICFDEPLTDRQVRQMQRATAIYLHRFLTPEEEFAAEDWVSGFAR
ncbi:MAG TPA: PilZ domain-containing protein [Sphingomicrobium sp.]|nr:PilZ domain-containing protein [Sphingomicrobium sp.]